MRLISRYRFFYDKYFGISGSCGVGFSDTKRELTFAGEVKNARVLGAALTVYGRRQPVAALIDRSCCCIEAMLGVLYAGNFCAVVEDRIKEIPGVAVDPIVVTDESCVEDCPAGGYDYLRLFRTTGRRWLFCEK